MSTKRHGLGKSLQSMFGEDKIKDDYNATSTPPTDTTNQNTSTENVVNENEAIDKDKVLQVRTSLVQPNVHQPREVFDEEKLKELADSIKNYGILQPLIVKKNGTMYEIIAGERRWRAAKLAGLETVPIIIKELDDRSTKEIALIENIQRENLNAVEEAIAYKKLIDDYGLTQEALAEKLGKNRSTITNTMRILSLNDEILDMIKSGTISEGHARALLGVEDENQRLCIAKEVAEKKLSVRDIEQLAKESKAPKEKKIKVITDEEKQERIVLDDLEKQLSTKLSSKVKIIKKDANLGKIEIEYYTKEDLDRLILIINSSNTLS